MTLISLENVSLEFTVRQQGRISFKEYLLRGMFRREGRAASQFLVRALNDINLSVHEGERVGIIGHNGAGKSTMLKMMAGVYPPTTGQRIVKGHVSSLFDIALGFEMDATGWENIQYRGYLLGETPRSIRAKMQPIAEFSELGRFLDIPVRYYSAGMLVRLAFSISTSIEPDILIVDEVLSAGDMEFQTKARARMKALMASARAVVIVSHDMSSLAQLCDRVLWLDHGTIRLAGPTDQVIAAYTQQAAQAATQQAA
jgi:lipopolysaccharide transport system ATP-binding protein